MDLSIIAETFSIITLAEFGDKTQLTALNLATSGRLVPVFLGCLLGVLAVDGAGVFIGFLLYSLLPMFWIALGSGIVFVVFGLYGLLKKEAKEEKAKETKASFLSSFSLIALMELGDKTQIAAIALSARYQAPIPVFIGLTISFILVMGVGVLAGSAIKRLIPRKILKIASSALFILFGVLFIISALTGRTII